MLTRQQLKLIRPIDWLMLLLAVSSVGLLCWEAWGNVSELQREWILTADYAFCAIFAAEFLWRWSRSGWRLSFALRNWYEILGMIPVAHPALRSFRLLRIIRIVVILARLGAAADRAFGEYFTYQLLRRFKQVIVDAIGGVVTLAVLQEVSKVLQKGHYTRNIARALEHNLDDLGEVVMDKLAEDPSIGRLSRLPFYKDIVRASTQTAFHVVLEILEDPRTDKLVADILQENLEQIRQAVQRNEEARDRATARKVEPEPASV